MTTGHTGHYGNRGTHLQYYLAAAFWGVGWLVYSFSPWGVIAWVCIVWTLGEIDQAMTLTDDKDIPNPTDEERDHAELFRAGYDNEGERMCCGVLFLVTVGSVLAFWLRGDLAFAMGCHAAANICRGGILAFAMACHAAANICRGGIGALDKAQQNLRRFLS